MKLARSFQAVALGLLVAAGACSSSTGPDEKPTRATIRVEGTAPGPLRLVVSTDFFESVVDGEVVQRLQDADTSFITLPYQATVSLSSLGSIYTQVANQASEVASVTLRVEVDTGQDFCPGFSGNISEGGSIACVFVFLQRRL